MNPLTKLFLQNFLKPRHRQISSVPPLFLDNLINSLSPVLILFIFMLESILTAVFRLRPLLPISLGFLTWSLQEVFLLYKSKTILVNSKNKITDFFFCFVLFPKKILITRKQGWLEVGIFIAGQWDTQFSDEQLYMLMNELRKTQVESSKTQPIIIYMGTMNLKQPVMEPVGLHT